MRTSILLAVLSIFITSAVYAADQAPPVSKESVLKTVTQLHLKRLKSAATYFIDDFSQTPISATCDFIGEVYELAASGRDFALVYVEVMQPAWQLREAESALAEAECTIRQVEDMARSLNHVGETADEAVQSVRQYVRGEIYKKK